MTNHFFSRRKGIWSLAFLLIVICVLAFHHFSPVNRSKLVPNSEPEPFKHSPTALGFSNSLETYLNSLKLSLTQISVIDDQKVLSSKFAFVTGFSDNHFREAHNCLRSFKIVWPNETLIVYNLGISENQVAELQKDFEFISVRKFIFSRYPSFVTNLAQYRWKPLIIAEVLTQYHRVVWMDASVVWESKPKFLEEKNKKKFGVLLFDNTGHTNLAATDPGVYGYLPGDMNSFRSTEMFSANLIFITAEKRAVSEVLRWWILCALEQNCMAPKGSKLSCNWKETERISYADCHRYDQAVLNTLLALANSYNTSLYTENLNFGKIVRT